MRIWSGNESRATAVDGILIRLNGLMVTTFHTFREYQV